MSNSKRTLVYHISLGIISSYFIAIELQYHRLRTCFFGSNLIPPSTIIVLIGIIIIILPRTMSTSPTYIRGLTLCNRTECPCFLSRYIRLINSPSKTCLPIIKCISHHYLYRISLYYLVGRYSYIPNIIGSILITNQCILVRKQGRALSTIWFTPFGVPSTADIGTRVLEHYILVAFHHTILIRERLRHGDGGLQFFLGNGSSRVLVVIAQALILYGVTSGKGRHTSQHAYQYILNILSFHTYSRSLNSCFFLTGKAGREARHHVRALQPRQTLQSS